jgi:hypothetical protein
MESTRTASGCCGARVAPGLDHQGAQDLRLAMTDTLHHLSTLPTADEFAATFNFIADHYEAEAAAEQDPVEARFKREMARRLRG